MTNQNLIIFLIKILDETKIALKKNQANNYLTILKKNYKLTQMKSIVIGSGFGGIAAALRLRAKNHSVTLIEKHYDLGWKSQSI